MMEVTCSKIFYPTKVRFRLSQAEDWSEVSLETIIEFNAICEKTNRKETKAILRGDK